MNEKTLTILDDESPEQTGFAAGQDVVADADGEASEASEGPKSVGGLDEVETLRTANAELAEQVKRTAAEFQNFRRRQEEEQKRVKVRIREEILRSLLPILDHLERTMAATAQGGEGSYEALLKGVQLIDKDVQKIFGDHGLEAIPAHGEIFDAALHQAVMMEETSEVPDQTILAELQKGFKLDDRVIRPAMVKVARNFEE